MAKPPVAPAPTPTISQRVAQLESQTPQVIGELQSVANRGNALAEVLDTVLDLVIAKGLLTKEDLEGAIKEKRLAKIQAKADAEAQQVAQLVANGALEVVESVTTPDTLVVWAEYLADGTKVPPGAARAYVRGLKPEIGALLQGKAIGDLIDVAEGRKLEILELYRPAAPKPPEPKSTANNLETPEATAPVEAK